MPASGWYWNSLIPGGRLQDGGTPGTNGDAIARKWFSAMDASIPNIQSPDTWPHLCTKEILSGNLAVHVK
ncbi:MAG: hypothetical protein KDC59_20700 [Saprospiraceae bacterium]|nr:hypothetical protein [Saprospiraceae bacterium]